MRKEISITSPDNYLATIQFRLNEMTNNNVDQEDSHEETLRYHTLTWVNAASSNGKKIAFIAPVFLVRCLNPVTRPAYVLPPSCELPEPFTTDIPSLCHILLNELQRLGMMKRYEGLKNTLELIKQNWLKEKLVLANWYLLMSRENYWIYSNQSTCDDNVLDSEITRCLQAHGHLHSEIDACVFFSHFGCWSTTPYFSDNLSDSD